MSDAASFTNPPSAKPTRRGLRPAARRGSSALLRRVRSASCGFQPCYLLIIAGCSARGKFRSALLEKAVPSCSAGTAARTACNLAGWSPRQPMAEAGAPPLASHPATCAAGHPRSSCSDPSLQIFRAQPPARKPCGHRARSSGRRPHWAASMMLAPLKRTGGTAAPKTAKTSRRGSPLAAMPSSPLSRPCVPAESRTHSALLSSVGTGGEETRGKYCRRTRLPC